MNKYIKDKDKNRSSKHNPKSAHANSPYDPFADIDALAKKIDRIARDKLRDGVMSGIMTGREPEVRQNAAIYLLKSFLLGNPGFMNAVESKNTSLIDASLNRAVAKALWIQKIRLASDLAEKFSAEVPFADDSASATLHPMVSNVAGWPIDVSLDVVSRALALAEQEGAITASNHAVFSLVLTGQLSVLEASRRRGVSRGAIYQHLQKVTKVLSPFLDRIDANFGNR